MKLNVKTDYLEKALNLANLIIPKKSPLLSLEGAKLTAQNTSLLISTTDLENEYIAEINCEVFKEGQTVIPLKSIQNLVSKIDYPEISLELKENNQSQTLILNSFGFTAELTTIDISEYPEFSLISNKFYDILQIQPEEFNELINGTAYCSSYPDESNPVFSGLLFEIDKKSLNIVATDGSQLAYRKTEISTNIKTPLKLIVPMKSLKAIQKNLENPVILQVENVENPHIISFKQKTSFGNIQIVSKLIEGNFPEYKEVIPTEYKTSLIISRKALLESIKRILVISKSKELSGIVIFQVTNNKMTVKSIESELGKAQEEIILKEKTGEDLTIYFNGKYLETMLNSIKEDEIELHFIDETSPMKINFVQDPKFLYLLMPIRITATV